MHPEVEWDGFPLAAYSDQQSCSCSRSCEGNTLITFKRFPRCPKWRSIQKSDEFLFCLRIGFIDYYLNQSAFAWWKINVFSPLPTTQSLWIDELSDHSKPPYLDLATTGFKQKNTAHFDCHAHLIHQPVQHFRFFCCVVFWKTQMSVLHKGYLRPSYHGFLSYSKPRTGCVYLGPCRLLPRQQELLQHCFPCLLIFFFLCA